MIKFPRVHIAASVANRILNVRDELERGSKSSAGVAAADVPPPVVPDPTAAGEVLDARVNEPPPADVPPLETPAEPPPDELAGILARGDNLISA